MSRRTASPDHCAHRLSAPQAKFEGCYTNATVGHLLPPPSEPLFPSAARLCPWRGHVRCHFHSIKCPLLRDSPMLPLHAGTDAARVGR